VLIEKAVPVGETAFFNARAGWCGHLEKGKDHWRERIMGEVRIHEQIFQAYPTFRRGIVFAANIQNKGPSQALESTLKEAVGQASERPIDLKSDPRILTWADAHRQFGSNPNKFPPAHAALLKRVQKGGVQIPLINRVVAIMNYNAIVDAIPVGGDDVDRAGRCLALRYASGDEVFSPLGAPDVREQAQAGEVIYVVEENGVVMCRRWNWRNGHATRITEKTTKIIMNIDGMGEQSEQRALLTRDRVAKMLEEHCGAETTTALLSPSQPSLTFPF
jgi:DNA/RNA-binding domain of Phe-tRNA-synthetase-like protein